VDIKFFVDLPHQLCIDEDERHENVHGSLVAEPEAERISTQVDIVEHRLQQNAKTIRNNEPDDQENPPLSLKKLLLPVI